ncbi:serine/arginine-rich splicing factor 4-like [Penaeus vannamei]|uniref:serine/arginine-rich splicing factor 4-like n=1 Tax=Penaeus vannamei TaxID=6689 RepID=UPI00387F538F
MLLRNDPLPRERARAAAGRTASAGQAEASVAKGTDHGGDAAEGHPRGEKIRMSVGQVTRGGDRATAELRTTRTPPDHEASRPHSEKRIAGGLEALPKPPSIETPAPARPTARPPTHFSVGESSKRFILKGRSRENAQERVSGQERRLRESSKRESSIRVSSKSLPERVTQNLSKRDSPKKFAQEKSSKREPSKRVVQERAIKESRPRESHQRESSKREPSKRVVQERAIKESRPRESHQRESSKRDSSMNTC